jgi:hypothetical protein
MQLLLGIWNLIIFEGKISGRVFKNAPQLSIFLVRTKGIQASNKLSKLKSILIIIFLSKADP